MRADWPPYNIEKKGEDSTASPWHCRLCPERGRIGPARQHASGDGPEGEPQGAEMLHQGIPSASFKQSFNLADHVKVGGQRGARPATIDLVREVPEQLSPRRIEVGSARTRRKLRSRTISRSRST